MGFLLVVTVFDLGSGQAFATSGTVTKKDIGSLYSYFEYGRSVESKVRQMIGQGAEQHPLLTAGWLESQFSPIVGTGKTMTVYGMSFAFNAAAAAQEFLDGYQVRSIGGPGAPLSHSYAALEQDPHWSDSDVVVLGILASSLPRIHSLTHMTGSWEAPCPHTYPRYALEESTLRTLQPEIASLQQFLDALDQGEEWNAFVAQLREHDAYFDPFIFPSVLDESVIVRLMRRGWGQAHTLAIDRSLHSSSGFREDLAELGRAILAAFIQQVRLGNRPLVVVLFNDRGYSDHLHNALEATLIKEEVRYVSTHKIAPAEDLSNFVPDGHFTATVNREIGKQLAAAIEAAVGR